MRPISIPASPTPASGRATALPARAEAMRAEHARAMAAGKAIAVLAIEPRLPGALATDGDLRERALSALFGVLRALPRTSGMIAFQGTDTIVALVSDLGLEQARALGDALITRSFVLAIPGLDARLGPAPCIGLAVADARHPHTLETLLSVAIEGASVARARGGACCTHTELYALCAERLEREGTASLASLFPRATAMGLVAPSTYEIVTHGPVATRPDTLVPRVAPQASVQSVQDVQPALAAPSLPAHPDNGSAQGVSRNEVELLERRVAKLVAQLEETERKLAVLERTKGVDHGIPSLYREVQGVDSEDERFKLKNDIMEQLLQANLELRACIAAQSASAV